MTNKEPKLSNCCNEPVYIHSMAMKCSKCNNACTIAENKQSVSAEEVLNRLCKEHENKYASFPSFVENETSLEVYELVIKSMEAYSNIVNATIIRKVEQLQSEATVNLKTIEQLNVTTKKV